MMKIGCQLKQKCLKKKRKLRYLEPAKKLADPKHPISPKNTKKCLKLTNYQNPLKLSKGLPIAPSPNLLARVLLEQLITARNLHVKFVQLDFLPMPAFSII